MITVIHGTDQVTTRNQIVNLKSKYSEVIYIKNSLDFGEIKQHLENAFLFPENNSKLLIFERVFSGKSANSVLLELLKSVSANIDILIWEEKEIKNKEFIAFTANCRVVKFNLPLMIFKFLDNFYPDNAKNLLSQLNNLEGGTSADLILFMLVKQTRIMLQLKSDTKTGSSELTSLQSWQKAKLINQVSYFTLDQLLKIYENLMMIDYDSKSGLSDQNIINKLKILIINL